MFIASLILNTAIVRRWFWCMTKGAIDCRVLMALTGLALVRGRTVIGAG